MAKIEDPLSWAGDEGDDDHDRIDKIIDACEEISSLLYAIRYGMFHEMSNQGYPVDRLSEVIGEIMEVYGRALAVATEP